MPEGPSGALLGLDFGTRKVGLAIGHPLTGRARSLDPVRYREPAGLDEQLRAVLARWRPARIIVGLPLSADGGETVSSRRVRDFAEHLGAELAPDIEIHLHDERLTSHAAGRELADRRRRGDARRSDARRLDSMAAALILESWMAEHD